jgi:hypothetical protein
VAHPGEHDAILDENLWESVQAKLSAHASKQRKGRAESGALIRGQSPVEVSYSAARGANTAVATAIQVLRAKATHRTSNSETISQKLALKTGADFRVKSPHSVNGDRYRTPRMARNGAVCATTRHSEWETPLGGWGTRIRT